MNAIAASPSCLQSLKAGTRSHHDAIELEMDADRLSDPRHHRKVMQALLDFHVAWEPRMLMALPEPDQLFMVRGSRWPQLKDDAEQLGLIPRRMEPRMDWLNNAEHAWGSAYVIWGSMLGGRVLCRQHQGVAGTASQPAPGWAYFHGHGDQAVQSWRDFACRLESRASKGTWHAAEALRAAQLTFLALTESMRRSLA